MWTERESKRASNAVGRSDRGTTAVEYALIIAGVVLLVLGGIQALSGAIGSVFGNQAGALAAPTVSPPPAPTPSPPSTPSPTPTPSPSSTPSPSPTPTPSPTQTTGSVAKKGTSTINVLSGVSGAVLTGSTITSEPSGTSAITWNANGTITYTAPNKSGTTVITFTYQLNGVTKTAALTLTVA